MSSKEDNTELQWIKEFKGFACGHCGLVVDKEKFMGRVSLKCPNPECNRVSFVSAEDQFDA